MDGYQPHLFLRIYAEVGSANEAAELVPALVGVLEDRAEVRFQGYSQYWKIPAYYGFDFDVSPGDEPNVVFDQVVALAMRGWTLMAGHFSRSAVWNPVEGTILLAPAVRWANLELWYASE
jgi:hypothetical protein